MYILKIDGHQVDFKDDVSIKFNYSNSDASDPAAVKNSFSYTVKLPGTSNNNKIFGDIWKTNRSIVPNANGASGAAFDPKKKVKFTLTNNGELIENGYVKLNKITSNFFMEEYDITLYGDLGSFFYDLSTNEDGTKKTLADLYYGFSPAIERGDSKAVMPAFDEDTGILMKWTSEMICEGWHELSYLREPTASTKVNNFITAVPCMTGLYNDFDSKSMIVNNLIRYQSITQECIDKWDQALPTAFTSDNVTYTLYQDPLSMYKSSYSKITYPRDLEGIEAGDLRASELPVAIKLSKVLEAIANPDNNGGFTVDYSYQLKMSDYWKYGWIMLEKPDFTLLPDDMSMSVDNCYVDGTITQVGTSTTVTAEIDVRDGIATWPTTPLDTTNLESPELNLVFNNKVTIMESTSTASTIDLTHISEITNNYAWGHVYHEHQQGGGMDTEWVQDGWLWHALFCSIDLYDGNTLMESHPVLFHIDNRDMPFGFDIVPESTWKPALLARINSWYGTSFSDMDVFQCINTFYANGVVEYAVPIAKVIPLNFTSTDFNVKFRVLPVAYYYGQYDEVGPIIQQAYIPYVDPLIDPSHGPAAAASYQRIPYHYVSAMHVGQSSGWRGGEFARYMHHRTNIGFNYNFNIGVVQEKEYYTTVNATKRVLLSNSMSPYELLTSVTKLMNYKYLYDKASKTVKIVPANEYFIPRVVDANSSVDLSKDLEHNFILSEQKYIDFSYDKNDSYPLYLWRKNNDKEYESFNFDTGSEFNFDTKKFFKNPFKQTALYQINSQFLQTFQGQILPSVFGTNVFDYSLFRQGQNSVIDEESVQSQTGCSNPNTKVKSQPWICMFDKSQRHLSSVTPSLVFLNGFYTNFRQIDTATSGHEVQDRYINVPKIMVSDDFYVQDYLNSDRCWLWSYETVYGDFTGWGYVFEHNAACWAMPMFSRDLTCYSSGASWYATRRTRASWDMIYDYTNYYTENGMTLVKYPTTFSLYARGAELPASAVTVIDNMDKEATSQNYLYPKFWQTTMEDMYDRDGRELTTWIDFKGEDPSTSLRKFYSLLGCTWMIEKMENVERADMRPEYVKCKLLKVKYFMDLMNYSKEQKQSLNDEIHKMIQDHQEEQQEE